MREIAKYTSGYSKIIEVKLPTLVKRRGSKTVNITLAKYRALRGVWVEVEIGGIVRKQKFHTSMKEAIKDFRSIINMYKLNTEGICS